MGISGRDGFQIFSSAAFFILGMIILFRSAVETGLLLGILVGGAFAAFGIFRLKHIWRHFVGRGRNS